MQSRPGGTVRMQRTLAATRRKISGLHTCRDESNVQGRKYNGLWPEGESARFRMLAELPRTPSQTDAGSILQAIQVEVTRPSLPG